MSSYMYNPSKQITKLLQEYLEFDPEQLKLGIWSGQLSLKDVNLKADAVYPLLNQAFAESETSHGEFTKSKPPIRLNLVSGTIGELNLSIPWQSLVWGQGDVKVNLRNVVIVLAFESLEETEERQQRNSTATEDDDSSESNVRFGRQNDHPNNDHDPVSKARRRHQKQRVLREAERRQLQGRDIASWLEKVSQKEEEERQREAIRISDPLVQQEGELQKWLKGATKDFFWRFYTGTQMKIENLKVVVIQDSIEFGVIIPSIQVLAGKQARQGSATSFDVSEGHQSNNSLVSPSQTHSKTIRPPPKNIVYESPDEDGEHADKHIQITGLGIYVRRLASASKKQYGEVECYQGLGERERGTEQSVLHLPDVSTKEYVMRPTEINVTYSLFFPYPPEKCKKKKVATALDTSDTASVSVAPSASSQSTGSKRRGKRDKASVEDDSPTAPTTLDQSSASHARNPSNNSQQLSAVSKKSHLSAHSKAKPPVTMRRTSIHNSSRKLNAAQSITTDHPSDIPPPLLDSNKQSTDGLEKSNLESFTSMKTVLRTGSGDLSTKEQVIAEESEQQASKRFARRSSMAGPLRGSTASAVVSRVPKEDNAKVEKRVAPLAHRDDLTTAFTASEKGRDMTARLHGDFQVGPLEVLLSSRHYNMIDNFFSACARMRNGRPSCTIASVLKSKYVQHSVRVTSSDIARATSVSTESAESLHLGLTAPLNERSKVVRSWWRYSMYAVRWEIQQRRKVRKHFQDKYLSFSWEQQKYRRKEYVTLYIAAKLLSPEEEGSRAKDKSIDEALVSCEDELPVEQILLYRAIARILHVGGLKEMPESLVGIRATPGYRQRGTSDDSKPAIPDRESFQRSSSGLSSDDVFEGELGNNKTALSLLEEACEIARLRMDSGHGEILPQHRQFLSLSWLEHKNGLEESTIGMTLDTRTASRGGANFSRAATRRSDRSTTSLDETHNASFKFSFTGSMEKLEFLVIEEDLDELKERNPQNEDGSSSGDSGMSVSNISELTEEERFSDSATQMTGADDESGSGPILVSTDFLLFRQPEKVLLRTEVLNISTSFLGQGSGSRHLNFKIGVIQALSGTNLKLLQIGSDSGRLSGSSSGDEWKDVGGGDVFGGPHDAVSLSLVLQKDQQVIQCDVATVKATCDVKAIASIVAFGASSRSPRPLIPSTPGETVRQYIVNQNVGTSFRFFAASFRLHGLQIILPQDLGTKGIENEILRDESNAGMKTQAMFTADMLEIYSGQAANSLGLSKHNWQEEFDNVRRNMLEYNAPARSLNMLDLDELIAEKSAFLAFNVVAAVSGLDFQAGSCNKNGSEQAMLSFFESPVHIEMFASCSESSVLDYNRAKREVVAKVSEVNAMVSESRLKLLADVLPSKDFSLQKPDTLNDKEVMIPPRLEILARLMLNSFDINITRLRFSIMTDDHAKVGNSVQSKGDQLEDFVTSFLRTVSKLDLSWPHEEALSSAMQICIDRLTGIGFALDDAWQCSNTALLNFLEDITGENQNNEDGDEAIGRLIQASVSRTVNLFRDCFDQTEPMGLLMENHLVVDFPDGIVVAAVDLYYDHFAAVIIDSAFVTNGEGIHLLRLMPEVGQAEDSQKQNLDARSDAVASYTSSHSGSSQKNPALILRWFRVNEKYSFGRGGLPLSVLGGEIEEIVDVLEECITDIDCGELELLFSEEVFEDVVLSLSEILGPLDDVMKQSMETKPEPHNDEGAREPVHLLLTSSCVSLLFTDEEFVPFTRLILGQCVTTSGNRPGDAMSSTKMSAKQFSVLYLSPSGELFPEQGCVHEMSPGPPLSLSFYTTSEGDSHYIIECRGLRLFLVYQFIAECIQYFYSGNVGFSLWMVNTSNAFAKFETTQEENTTTSIVEFSFFDCSILIPRSSTSSEMVAIEVDQARMSFERVKESFTMPSGEVPLNLAPILKGILTDPPADSFATAREEEDHREQHVSDIFRTTFELRRFRIFTAMTESNDPQHFRVDGERETLAFNCFFEIDGRAAENKRVYRQIATPQNYYVEKDKATRCWREITSAPATLKIVADYAPHLRILVTDEIDNIRTHFGLETALSQFCLLMSCWYANMSELPAMFPYSATELEVGSKNIANPLTFPEFGTEEYMNIMRFSFPMTSEFAMLLSSFSLKCTTDRHFETVTTEAQGIVLGFDHCTLHTISDNMGITKVGFGALGARFDDHEKVHSQVIHVGNDKQCGHSWADFKFGLDDNCSHMIETLSLPFQMSVFLAPKAALYNLGMDCPTLTMSDFSTMFGFLGFISVYFCEPDLGFPQLKAEQFLNEIKKSVMGTDTVIEDGEDISSDYLTDFRLWLSKPSLWVPIDPSEIETSFLSLTSEQGLWYRCATIDLFLSQEGVIKGLNLSYIEKDDVKNKQSSSRSLRKTLFEGLSLGFRIDYNGATNHTDYSLKVPCNEEWECSVKSSRISVDPIVLPRPSICKPAETLDRFLGPIIFEATLVIDILPVTFATLSNLFMGQSEPNGENSSHSPDKSTGTPDSVIGIDTDDLVASIVSKENNSNSEGTFSLSGNFGDMRLYALDPVLGAHLPVAVVSVASMTVTASKFSDSPAGEPSRGEAPPEDMQIFLDGHIWADSFKLGPTRSWEPLIEAYRFYMIYENSRYRGSGVTLKSDVPLNINITGANLLVLDASADSVLRQFQETFAQKGENFESVATGTTSMNTDHHVSSKASRERMKSAEEYRGMTVVHEYPRKLSQGARVAFSLKNKTGQSLRSYRFDIDKVQERRTPTLSYVENESAVRLLFQPSVSMVSNMDVVEVGYPGLENSPSANFEGSGSLHELDIQIPGFQWMRRVKIDNFGRHFVNLTPLSSILNEKATDDWRIENVMKLLVEVGLENGGRALTARSIFSVVNKTTHPLSMIFNPNSSFDPSDNEEDLHLESGDIYQIPVLLLESALRCSQGMELGCVWLRPFMGTLPNTFREKDEEAELLKAEFSSRPVKLGKVVADSALLFEASKGEDIAPEQAQTGVQISCPVLGGSRERELAPFCYAIEVGRSPIVQARHKVERLSRRVHGPVTYTLSVYAPFVIANMLPEAGRFELMHAVRRTVVWFADLEPGEQVSVHSVGLDAPLLLLISLRFCRTPIGEGALVHHGVDPPPDAREHLSRLRSLGKAGKAATKQIGKAVMSLGDTPDKRGQQRIFTAQDRENRPGVRERRKNKTAANVNTGDDDELDVKIGDGKTYRVDTTVYFPENCVEETVVVDHVGQRLTLGLENIRGGGGQRRISVYCPFWIINTTEHALLYRQYGTKQCVSGSVVSPQMDGSLTLTGGHHCGKVEQKFSNKRNFASAKPLNQDTIFAGTPGALATSRGRCDLTPNDLAPLLQETLSLEDLSRLAFMFNFHEGSVPGYNQRVCVQLHDGTNKNHRYHSDWSLGVGLDSVGISRVVDMNCKDGRSLELSMVAQIAPGHLAKYTKIVRFLPRYVVVNNLPYPIRLWQDNSIFRPPSAADITIVSDSRGPRRWRLAAQGKKKKSAGKINQYETLWGREVDVLVDEADMNFPEGTTAHPSALHVMSVPASAWKPFNLPDSRGDRQLRVGLGGSYNLTASISADVPGEHTLRITRAVDLRLLKHVSTRASPQYIITLPPVPGTEFTGEFGIWFETEWGTDRSLIVKAIKANSYCYNKTDVHVGDELLLIDGVPVTRMTFSEAMNVLRRRIGEIRSISGTNAKRMSRMSNLRFGGLTTRFSSQSFQDNDLESTNATNSLTLTFRTVEERLRRVRLKAARNNSQVHGKRPSEIASPLESDLNESRDSMDKFLKAELKTLHKSMYLVLSSRGTVPYEVHNRTQSSTIYFRQRGCHSHLWRVLKPGASEVYCWEEPMKAKRLTVRVATEDLFVFVPQDGMDVDGASDIDMMSEVAELGHSTLTRQKNFLSRNINDEEDAEFSQSVSVRLEEIGFRDFLHYGPGGHRSKHLELEVDVVGSTRVLIIRDVSAETGTENQLLSHLEALKARSTQEQDRTEQLKELQAQISGHQDTDTETKDDDNNLIQASMDTARELMNDFPEEKTITRVHQMVVEVLEATGLSPDNYVGLCNPFVEVSLRSGNTGRANLFQSNKQLHRTYFIRRSVNPQWNSQSFIFDIPHEAVNVTRGHAVKVKVRNFRTIGRHAILGRAQIDLHSVKGNSPLLGWFPLAGRTGRRELENSLSHWGRGSIKLRIHWVYSIPGLIDYFLILAETRLADLRESVEGMSGQLEKRRDEERKRMERIDGFKAVRVNDLAPTHRRQSTPTGFQPRIALRMEEASGVSSMRRNLESPEQKASLRIPSMMRQNSATTSSTRHAPSVRTDVEDQISIRRQKIQQGSLFGQHKRTSVMTNSAVGGTASVQAFRSWEEVKVFFNDDTLDIRYDGHKFTLQERRKAARSRNGSSIVSSEERQLIGKLKIPSSSPALMQNAAREHASQYSISRASVERHTRSLLRAALNPGGWLIIRPIQALNLPDSHHGMFVKVRYGSESFVSETVDSTVYPTWFKPQRDGLHEPASPESLEYFPGDIHIFVPPQKTSGYIRISVVGEGHGQRINQKTELGVLQIPLGAAITACIDAVEDYFDSQMVGTGSSPVYLRWFPLEDPKSYVPVEGDRKMGSRPREPERDSDNLFTDYFSPCIQLALIWSPEVESLGVEPEGVDLEDLEGGRLPERRETTLFSPGASGISQKSNQASMVESYFNADVEQISCALIDSRKARELISGCICDIDIRYWVTKAKTRFGVAVGWFQLDQQDDYAQEPVILAPTPSEYIATVFQILALKDNLRSKNDVLSFEFIDFSVAEFDITLEETLLTDVTEFLSSLRLRGALTKPSRLEEGTVEDLSTFGDKKSLFDLSQDVQPSDPHSSLLSLLAEGEEEVKGKQRVYIEQLFLGVVKFNLSYLKGTKETKGAGDDPLGVIAGRTQDTANRVFGIGLPSTHHEKSDIFSTWSQHTADETGATFALPSLFTSLLPAVSDAPVRLQGKALNHVFESPGEIIQSIRKFYVNETLKQIYKIIGSLDFVGNPTMLFTSFVSGLRDLILIPSQAIIKSPNPSSVALGFGKGTLSLVSHSFSGFFGFTSKIFAAAGQGIAALSCDRDFRNWHRDNVLAEAGNLNRTWKKRGVRSVRQMVVRPIGDIAIGIGSGVVGIVLSPIKGYRRSGGVGLTTGVAAGLSGIIIKPTVGVLDAVSHFTASIYDVAKSVNILEKRFQPPTKYRLPYVFATNKILMSFDDAQARALYLLRLFPMKAKHRPPDHSEEILVHVEVLQNIGTDTYAIVTSARLLLVRLKNGGGGSVSPTLCWQTAILGNTSVSSQVAQHGHNGFALKITLKKKATPDIESEIERQSGSESLPLSTVLGDSDSNLVDQSLMTNAFETGTEEFDHGTSRGEKGELVEWFTVIAEYQYRRQLAKLHNAICCVSGNLQDVIHDPTLGRPGSSEGYTSFGIFYFGRTAESTSKHKDANNSLIEVLEEAPWRLGNDLEEDPEWLRNALQEASKAKLERTTQEIDDSIPGPEESSSIPVQPTSRRVRKIARWIKGRLPTIADNEEENASPDRSESFGEYGDISQSMAKNENSISDETSNYEDDTSSSSIPLRRLSSRSLSRTSSLDSFMSARDFLSSDDSFRVPSDSVSSSQGDSFASAKSAMSNFFSAKTGKSVSFRRAFDSEQGLSSQSPGSPPYTIDSPSHRRNLSDQTEVHSNRSFTPTARETDELDEHPQVLSDNQSDRLQRMESIMEQLLLFSSEQALQNMAFLRGQQPLQQQQVENLSDPLRQEVHELRAQLEFQSKKEQEAYRELEKLRQEVSNLAKVVAVTRGLKEDPQTRSGESEHEEIGEEYNDGESLSKDQNTISDSAVFASAVSQNQNRNSDSDVFASAVADSFLLNNTTEDDQTDLDLPSN